MRACRAWPVSAGSAGNARRLERAGVGSPRLAQLTSLRRRARCACSRARSCFCLRPSRVTTARRGRVLHGPGATVDDVTDEFSSPPRSLGANTKEEEPMTANLSTRTRWLALVILCVGDLMIVVDTTVVNVALPSIRASLGFSQTSLAWVVNAYMLTFGGFLLLAGRLGDLFGHRRLFLIGTAAFTTASLVCGVSDVAGDADRRAGRAGARRRGRLSGRVLADRRAVHRAGRAREGDGRVRFRYGGWRQHRRARGWRADRPRRLALDLPRQPPDRDRRDREWSQAPAGRGHGCR